MMERIKDEEGMRGKTIREARRLCGLEDHMIIVFTDDTFVEIEGYKDEFNEQTRAGIVESDVSIDGDINFSEDHVDMEILTRDEFNEIADKEFHRQEIRRFQRVKEDYERLKRRLGRSD